MKILILSIFVLFGSVSALAVDVTSSTDPNLAPSFDGALTFGDPSNPFCKRCYELQQGKQSFSRDMAGTFAPQSLGRFNPNMPMSNQGTIRNPPVKTGQ